MRRNIMSRVFAYVRVSTADQTTDNQVLAIRNAGHVIEDSRIISETISGGVNAMERPLFKAMIEHKLEKGDTLIVQRLDRLGRDNIDIQQLVTMFADKGIKFITLDLPVNDLTTSEGKLMLQFFSAFAEFEKNRIRERTKDGLARAKKEGKKLGRPVNTELAAKVKQLRDSGISIAKVAEKLNVSTSTVKRLQKRS